MFSWVRELADKFKTWEVYCFKCRCKQNMNDPRIAILPNGRKARQGTCAYCGTPVSLISGID